MRESHILRKFSIPMLPPTILHRQSLVTMLNEAVMGTDAARNERPSWYKVILLCAPSGYGKTILLIDFARRTPLPCCWYFLEQADTDKITFLESLIASIQQRFPQFGANLGALLMTAAASYNIPENLNTFVDTLAATIEAEIPEHFVIILYNFHEVNASAAVLALIDHFIQRMPPQCVLVIESRAVPKLELAAVLARRELFGMGSNVLRFSPQEVRDLACLQGAAPLTDEEATQLTQTFDGWIVGILLGTRLGDFQEWPSLPLKGATWGSPALRMDYQNLFAYLTGEVFSRDPEVYSFLREAAILQHMTPTMCNALLKRTDAQTCLHYLEQQGLFVTQSGEGEHCFFTCHPLLRELLCEELRNQAPERFTSLHYAAAELFRAAQDYSQTLYHAHLIGDHDLAAQVIMEAYQREFDHGHVDNLARWIDELSPEVKERYPRLLVMRANIRLSLGDLSNAFAHLAHASEIIDQRLMDHDERLLLKVEIALMQSKALFFAGKYIQARDLCQQTLALIPADEVALCAEVHLRLGMCAQVLGNFADCITELQQALHLWRPDTEDRRTARIHSQLANTYGLMGHLALSEHHRARAVLCLERLHDEQGEALNLTGMGVTLQRQGNFAEAEAVLLRALDIARGPIRFHRAEAYALVSLGDVYQDQRKYKEALTMMADGLELAGQLGDQYLLNYTNCALALTYLFMGDPLTASLLATEREQPSSSEALTYNEAMRVLTRGTISLHQENYTEALSYLVLVEKTFQASGFSREQLQSLLRLAACYCAFQKIGKVVQCLEAALVVATQHGYEELVQVETQRMPPLLQAMQNHPEVARFRAFLLPEEKLQEMSDTPPLDVSPSLDVTPEPERVLEAPEPGIQQGESSISVLALGEPAVLLDGKPITRWRMARAMELCFFLLDRARPVHKEQIIETLWPNVDEPAEQTLRSTVYYLRKALGESCIIYRSGAYMLDFGSRYGKHITYDVALFEEYHKQAKQAIQAGSDEEAYKLLQQMVQLYRGDYVQSFYSDWCSLRRDELRQTYLDARRQLALITWRSKAYDESATHWRHMLAIDNCMEEAHYGLMGCFVHQGKRNLALRQYQRCAEALQEGFGVKPGQNIQNLYNRLIANQ